MIARRTSKLASRAFTKKAYSSDSIAQVTVSTCFGNRTSSLADCFSKLAKIDAEIKESRQLRLGGKEVKMFLTVGATEEALKKCFNSMEFTFVDVTKARDTMQDTKGPYCETSPLLPFVRRSSSAPSLTRSIAFISYVCIYMVSLKLSLYLLKAERARKVPLCD